ncbi:secretion/conjugation apparatus DotM-related subunit [Microbulbifer epialgicus]
MIAIGVAFVFALLFVVLWFTFHTYLSIAVVKIAWWCIPVIEYTHAYSYKIAISLGVSTKTVDLLIPAEIINELPNLKYWLPRIDPSQIKFKKFVELLEVISYALRILLPFLTVISIIYIVKRSKTARMNRVMNIMSLAKLSMDQFPQIRPAIIENLLKKDPDTGYFRREASPIRFAIINGLIKAYKTDFRGALISEIVTPVFNKQYKNKEGYEYIVDNYSKGISKLHNRCILDTKETERVFINQLGKVWTSSDNLPPFIRGLYAALIAFVCADKDTSIKLLDQFNRSWIPPKKSGLFFNKTTVSAFININGVDDVIAKYEHADSVQEILSNHAYVNTVMAVLLEAARTKGSLATSLFIWLKVVDRNLWYSLNQEGGQCAWTEGAGPRAHKLAEIKAKGPLYHPFVDTAVAGYEDYLRNTEGWLPLAEDLPKTDRG